MHILIVQIERKTKEIKTINVKSDKKETIYYNILEKKRDIVKIENMLG